MVEEAANKRKVAPSKSSAPASFGIFLLLA
jgi:hypothetical protein